MSRLIDHEALTLDLKARLLERASWGRGQLLELIAELEQEHRLDESADAAFLRRFGDALHDQFLGLVPRTATTDPIPLVDPEASPFRIPASATDKAMDAGAASDPPREGGDACPPSLRPRSTPRPTPVSPQVVRAPSLVARAAPATR